MKKTIKIIGLCLLGLLAIGSCVFYIVDKEQFIYILDLIKDFVNQPLPIVGITVGALLIFVWRLVISFNFGKKRLAQYDSVVEQIKKEYEDYVKTTNEKQNALLEENAKLRHEIANVCALSINKKIKDYGKELEHGKEINNETTNE